MTTRPRPVFIAVLAMVAVFGAATAWQRAHRPGGRWVGRTHCSWVGEPRVTIRPGLARVESIATVAHEAVHVSACRRLGPVRYRLSTLGAQSNLHLEAPAYCAAAHVRLRNGWSLNTVRSTVLGDMLAAMGDKVDSATIHRTIVSSCPVLAPSPSLSP
jgi:hypothetical protein